MGSGLSLGSHRDHPHISWEIPFSFLAFQWTAIIYLYHRNQYIDRAAISLMLLIAVLEVFQTAQWMFGIDPETTTATHCNMFNQMVSHIVMTLLFLFPVVQLKFAQNTSFYNSLFGADMVRKAVLKVTVLFYYLWFLCSIGVRVYDTVTSTQPLCTFIGEHGHQDWSSMLTVDLMKRHTAWTVVIHTLNALYLVPNVLLFALYRPLWVISCHALCTLGSFGGLYAFYGTEAFSMWSLISLFNFVWILLSPHIAKCMVNRGYISFHNPSNFLYGSHGHLLQHKVLDSELTDAFDDEEEDGNESEMQRML